MTEPDGTERYLQQAIFSLLIALMMTFIYLGFGDTKAELGFQGGFVFGAVGIVMTTTLLNSVSLWFTGEKAISVAGWLE